MEINQTKVIRARILLAYLEAYHPKEHALFIAALGDILQSFENEQYVDTVLRHIEGFLLAHPEDQERLQSVSPREMVEEVGQQLMEDAKKRRGGIRLRAKEIVNNYVHGTTTEKQVFEDKLVASINASISRAETPQQLRRAIEEEVATLPVPAKEIVQQFVDPDPLSAQRLLLTSSSRDSVVVEHIASLPAPAWRGYIAAVENLQMGPNETFEEHTKRAKEIGQTAAFLSADFSQTPAAHAEPGRLVSAILEATENRTAIKTFEGLAEQTKNMVSLMVVAKAWEDAVDVVTKRAGGALAKTLEPIIQEMNKQPPPGGAIKQAASLVSGVINPLLGRTLADIAVLEELNRLLPPGRKVLPEKTGAFIASPQELFLLTTYIWKPEGVVLNQRHIEGSLEPAVWSVRWAADGAIGKIFNRAAKSEGAKGFFGKILGFFGIRVGGAAAGAASGAAGKAATGGLIKVFGSLVGVLSGPWGWAMSIIGGLFAAPLFNKAKNWFSNLLAGRIGKLGTAQDAIVEAFGGRAGGRSAQEEQKKTDFYIALLIGVPIILLIAATMFQITVRDSALFVAGQENQPEEFQDFGQTYPPPDYIDFSTLASKEFNCLSFGEGIYAGPGPSARLEEKEANRIINTINNYPQLKALSCGLGCPDKKITITKFTNASSYGGFAPSARPGNVILYQHAFTRYGDQTFAYLLAHELAHNIDWFNSPIATGFESLGCSGVPSTYKFAGNPSESFAESVALYLIGHPEARSYCGGRAFSYLNQEFSQCR